MDNFQFLLIFLFAQICAPTFHIDSMSLDKNEDEVFEDLGHIELAVPVVEGRMRIMQISDLHRFPKGWNSHLCQAHSGAQLIKLRSWHRPCKTYFPEMAGGNVWFNKRQNRSLPLDANAPPGQTSDAACLQLLRKLTKAVRPDLVVLTGDILDGRVSSFVLRVFRFSCCQ